MKEEGRKRGRDGGAVKTVRSEAEPRNEKNATFAGAKGDIGERRRSKRRH